MFLWINFSFTSPRALKSRVNKLQVSGYLLHLKHLGPHEKNTCWLINMTNLALHYYIVMMMMMMMIELQIWELNCTYTILRLYLKSWGILDLRSRNFRIKSLNIPVLDIICKIFFLSFWIFEFWNFLNFWNFKVLNFFLKGSTTGINLCEPCVFYLFKTQDSLTSLRVFKFFAFSASDSQCEELDNSVYSLKK